MLPGPMRSMAPTLACFSSAGRVASTEVHKTVLRSRSGRRDRRDHGGCPPRLPREATPAVQTGPLPRWRRELSDVKKSRRMCLSRMAGSPIR